MRSFSVKQRRICLFFCIILAVFGFVFFVAAAHQCNHGHDHHIHHHHHHDHDHPVRDEDVDAGKRNQQQRRLLPEEIAEEEDLKLMWTHQDYERGHGHLHKHDFDVNLSGIVLWIHAMGCSLLVSLASLICLILLPFIFIQGKPSKAVVDSLALFGAGAMLGDAFLHQLPHAFGGDHSHSQDHHDGQTEHHVHSGHSHSLKDLSIGLSILAGIVIFLIVEKIVRYVDDFSGGANAWNLGHHHHNHHHKHTNKLKDDRDAHGNHKGPSVEENNGRSKETVVENGLIKSSADSACDDKPSEKDVLRKRITSSAASENSTDLGAESISDLNVESINRKEPIMSQSNLVFGYLNLFSDGVHNFTDGMALGSAFLLYGSVGGWSRTLFLLAHELPQEIGDFGILVRSGFRVSKALCFNFLSALVALAGTALALTLGKDPGQSSLIEGFTAGGFIYIALAGVLAEMNNGGSSGLRSTSIQLTSLLLGMAVALCISIIE